MGHGTHTEGPRAHFYKPAMFVIALAGLALFGWSMATAGADPPSDPFVCCMHSAGFCSQGDNCPHGTTPIACPCPPPY